MKALGLFALALIAFVATIVAALAATGNLNKESLMRLSGKEEVVAEAPAESKDDLSPLLKALKEREEALNKREEDLKRKEDLVAIQQKDLDNLKAELDETLEQVKASLQEADASRDERLTEVAKSFEAMKAENAAAALESWPTEDAADILQRVKEKGRGKILDKMEPAKAAMILKTIQDPIY